MSMAGAGNLMLVTLLVAPAGAFLGGFSRDAALSRAAFAGFALIAAGLAMIDGRLASLIQARGGIPD